jgi:hypothetical protein
VPFALLAIASAISEVGDMSGLPSMVKQILHAPLDEKSHH